MRKARRGSGVSAKELGLAEKISKKEWVEAGRLEKLSEDRLKSLFVLIAVVFFDSVNCGREPLAHVLLDRPLGYLVLNLRLAVMTTLL